MFVLLTNDDGFRSPGLFALSRALASAGHTLQVVAPARQRSWIGKAISNPGPLTVSERTLDGLPVQVVDDGTPSDCVNLALYHLCPRPPDLVISGINPGANFTRTLALASGTVRAALEAAIHGVPALAVNLALDRASELLLQHTWSDEHLALFELPARAATAFVSDLFPALPPAARVVNLVVPSGLTALPRFCQAVPLAYDYGSVFVRKSDGTFTNRSIGFVPEYAAVTPESDVALVGRGFAAYSCYAGALEFLPPNNPVSTSFVA